MPCVWCWYFNVFGVPDGVYGLEPHQRMKSLFKFLVEYKAFIGKSIVKEILVGFCVVMCVVNIVNID